MTNNTKKRIIIKIDYEKILEAIETLLQNAYEELSEKEIELETNYEKNVIIKIYTDNNEVCFSVKDNGRGISEENKNKIFEKYFTTGKRDKKLETLEKILKELDKETTKMQNNKDDKTTEERIKELYKILKKGINHKLFAVIKLIDETK